MGPTLPKPLRHARKRQVWLGQSVQSRSASTDRCDCHCCATQNRRRIRQSFACHCYHAVNPFQAPRTCLRRSRDSPVLKHFVESLFWIEPFNTHSQPHRLRGRIHGTPGTPRGKNDWKQNSNRQANDWATNLSPSNPRLHNEPVRRAGVSCKLRRLHDLLCPVLTSATRSG